MIPVCQRVPTMARGQIATFIQLEGWERKYLKHVPEVPKSPIPQSTITSIRFVSFTDIVPPCADKLADPH